MSPNFEFQWNTTRYSPQNAYWLAKASQLAYEKLGSDKSTVDGSKISEVLNSWDSSGKLFTEIETFNHKSTQSFVAKSEKFIIASFRGTNEWQDWLDNIKLTAIPHNLGRVHRGFQAALEDVWDKMLATINKFKDNHQTLWITGHSLGGALATLAAAERINEDQPWNGLYTFGQPRCVDRTMSRNINIEAKGRIFRFQNNNDIVTRIPQRLMGYSHTGTFVYIDKDKKIHTDIHWWNQFLDRFGGILEALPKSGVDKIEDHSISDYIAALEKNINLTPRGL